MTDMGFGERVRRARDARHWTQAHLAGASRVAERTIRRVENGGTSSKETVLSLCATLGIDPAEVTGPARSQDRSVPEPEDARHGERLALLVDTLRRSFPDSLVSATDVVAYAGDLFAGTTERDVRARVRSVPEPSYGLFTLLCHVVVLGYACLAPVCLFEGRFLVLAAATAVAALPLRVMYDCLRGHGRALGTLEASGDLYAIDTARRSAYALSRGRVSVASVDADGRVTVDTYATSDAVGIDVVDCDAGRHATMRLRVSRDPHREPVTLPWLPMTPGMREFLDGVRATA